MILDRRRYDREVKFAFEYTMSKIMAEILPYIDLYMWKAFSA